MHEADGQPIIMNESCRRRAPSRCFQGVRNGIDELIAKAQKQTTQPSICDIVVVRSGEQGVPSPRHKLGRSVNQEICHSGFSHYSHMATPNVFHTSAT
jgi:hypothetical protein